MSYSDWKGFKALWSWIVNTFTILELQLFPLMLWWLYHMFIADGNEDESVCLAANTLCFY